jgi:hypothetical protein
VAVPSDDVVERLRRDPAALFGASGRVLELRTVRHLGRSVRLGLGALLTEEDGSTVLPVWWEALEHPRRFPTFDGGLAVGKHGDGTAELRLEGSYLPPLGAVGAFADTLLGHRFVTASLEVLLNTIADCLTQTRLDH